jgi:O-antigen ligase
MTAFGIGTLLAVLAGRTAPLKLVYPVGALAIGVVLFRYYPALYLGFLCWLWFLSPLVRRLIDYQLGYDSLNPVLAAPVLVTALSLLSLIRHLPKLGRSGLAPLVLPIVSLVYAYPLGIFNTGLSAATYSLFLWLTPIALGFHLAVDVGRYRQYQATIRRVFVWGALILGLYGVWQFIDPAQWDRYWMASSGMVSIGQPLPYEVRVFGTLNSPTPFAMVMLAGMMMLLDRRAPVHVAVGVPAYLAFLLSLVRTAWAGWVVGAGVYATYLPARRRLRLLIVLGTVALALALLASPPIEQGIERRFRSFSNLSEDRSLAARQESGAAVLGMIVEEPWGRGLGATGSAKRLATAGQETFDNGFLNVFLSLGWFGGVLYLTGTVLILVGLVRRFEPRTDPLPKAARALGIATFAALSSLNTLASVTGVMFWGFIGLAIAGRLHYSRPMLPGGTRRERRPHPARDGLAGWGSPSRNLTS